ncbi:MAG TPA: DUF58 domain-containing protein [Terriglobales bacterium]|nr:DUF58 domain-containing protein [Terriglobales bacterium]
MGELPKTGKERSLAELLHLGLPEVWVRFLVALLGLGLAFAAALASTLAREDGNVAATAMFATAALLLAGLVGLTTVPYLARRVAAGDVRDAFDYEVTRAGLIYIGLTLVLALAGLNTGNNLLWIVVAAMLAAIVVSGLSSALVLRGLELDVHTPEHVFAGHPVMARLMLHNRQRLLPSFSVSVAPPRRRKKKQRWEWQAATFGFPFNRPAEEQWFHLPDRVLRREDEPEGQGLLSGPVYFAYLAAGSSLWADVELRFQRRGLVMQDSFGLRTQFPFSFLRKTRRVALARQVVVFPAIEPTDEFFEVLPLIRGEFEAFLRGRGYDLYRIRDYAPEDSARHVDWKASAKAGSLLVREFTREDERKLRIVFDNPAPGAVSEAAYERAVSLAASLAWHFASENSQLSFVAPGYQGGPDVYRFLTYLALVQPNAGESVIDQLPASNDFDLILTARARGTIPTALWTRGYVLFIK